MAIVLPMEPGTTGTERETSKMKRAGATVNEETTRVIKAAYRCWMVTVHDQTWKGPNVEHALFRYFVAWKEVCPTSGRLHWQGYIELKDKARLGKVKEVLGCPLLIWRCAGSQAEAIAYCQKAETGRSPMRRWNLAQRPRPEEDRSELARELVEVRVTATARPWTQRSLMRRLWT